MTNSNTSQDKKKKLTPSQTWLLAAVVFGGIGIPVALIANDPKLTLGPTDSTAGPAVEPPVPEGWKATGTDGVFFRLCTDTDNCPTDGVIGDQSYWLYEFWCRDRPCDLYVKGIIYNAAGQSIGWTNDTGSGAQGDKVIITLSTFMDGAESMRVDEVSVQ